MMALILRALCKQVDCASNLWLPRGSQNKSICAVQARTCRACTTPQLRSEVCAGCFGVFDKFGIHPQKRSSGLPRAREIS